MPDETHPLNDGQAAWLDDLLGKGKGDPDFYDPETGLKGEWFILENGDHYKVATTEDIAANLKAVTPF